MTTPDLDFSITHYRAVGGEPHHAVQQESRGWRVVQSQPGKGVPK